MDHLSDLFGPPLLGALLLPAELLEPGLLAPFVGLGLASDFLQLVSRLLDRRLRLMDGMPLGQDRSSLAVQIGPKAPDMILPRDDVRDFPLRGAKSRLERVLPAPELRLGGISGPEKIRQLLLLLVVAGLRFPQGTLGGIQSAAQMQQVGVEAVPGLGGHEVSV